MTEQEIIQILKDNKEKGIGFIFMPEEVRMWITSNLNKLMYYNGDTNKFEKMEERINCRNYYDLILTIDDSKFIKKGEWVEFDIDEDGFFCYAENERHYFWSDWNSFLIGYNNYSIESNRHFIAFGGCKYRNCEAWYMVPQMFLDDHYVNVAFKDEDSIKPAVPVKIRFWRKVK